MEPALIHKLWRSGFVNRWHCNDDWRLRMSGDMNGGHCQRVAILYFGLFGFHEQAETVMRNILVALLHDAPELISGDIPQPGKQRVPELRTGDKAAATKFWDDMKLPNFSHKSEEMSLCDLLDAILMVCDRAPELLARSDWASDVQAAGQMAEKLGVSEKVDKLIKEVRK